MENYFENNEFYKKNLSLLERKEGAFFVEKIKKASFPENVEIIKKNPGFPTVRVTKKSGQKVLLHSIYDPVKGAKNFISGFNLEDTRFLIVLGFGLGYHIKEVLENYPWIKFVVIIEPQLSLFKLALNLLDFTFILSSPKVKIILEDRPFEIKNKIFPLGEIFLTGKTSIICHNSYFTLLGKKIEDIKKSIKDTIFFSRANLTTNMLKGCIFQKNILTNLPQIINNPGIKNLFSKFEKRPVICVAAGPSLDKNVHLLKNAKNKALIICVDAALRTLLRHQIEPDIVVSIDYSQGARSLFDGVMEQTKNFFLAADPEVCPSVLSDFRGKKFIINLEKPLTKWFDSFMEDKGFLNKGASVAHTAFSLAVATGGDPIILVGQDLSFPEGITHAKEAIPRKKIFLGIDRKTGKKYLLSKDKNGKWQGRDLIMIKDIYGNEVPTSEDMYSYLIYFERLISMYNGKCIDATEGGARIEGTEIMSLNEAIKRYCTKDIKVKEILEEAAKNKEKVDLQKLKEEMKKTVMKLKEVNFYADEGKKVVKELYRKVKQNFLNSREINRLANESNKLRKKITKVEPHIRSFLEQEMTSYLYLAQRKTNLRMDKLSRRKKFLTQVEKVAIFYDGVKEATGKLLNDFQSALDNLA